MSRSVCPLSHTVGTSPRCQAGKGSMAMWPMMKRMGGMKQ
jgi:hypothetical protein